MVDARLARILKLVRRHVPDLRLVQKEEVRWMRWVGGLLRPLIPEFSNRYTTVLGRTVFLPRPAREMPPRVLASTLAHELVHQLDQQRWGPLFYFSYGFCLPAGRSLRAHWERRAYAVDLLLARERGGVAEVERVADTLADLFGGRSYLWMWAGRDAARAFLEPAVEAVRTGELDHTEPYASILKAWRGTTETREEEWASKA
jgi:hypothetical protein